MLLCCYTYLVEAGGQARLFGGRKDERVVQTAKHFVWHSLKSPRSVANIFYNYFTPQKIKKGKKRFRLFDRRKRQIYTLVFPLIIYTHTHTQNELLYMVTQCWLLLSAC